MSFRLLSFFLMLTCLQLVGTTQLFAKSDIPEKTLQHQQPILLISLEYDFQANTATIKSLKKSHGFIPDYRTPAAVDYLPITLEAKSGPQEYFIPLPSIEIVEGADNEGKLTGQATQKNRVTLTAIVPYEKQAKVKIKKAIGSKPFKDDVITTLETPELNAPAPITSNNFSSSLSLQDLSTSSVDDYTVETIFDGNPAETDPKKTLDLVFFVNYPTLPGENQTENLIYRYIDLVFGLQNYPGKQPFNQYKHLVKVRQVNAPSPVSEQNYIISELLTSLSVPHDHISLVNYSNQGTFATLGGGFHTLNINEYTVIDTALFAHEFGHSFAGLLDEYVRAGYWGGELNYLHRNCKEDPSIPWINNIQEGAAVGCNYETFFFSPNSTPASSMMRYHAEHVEFNQVSRYLIEQALNSYKLGAISAHITPEKFDFGKPIDPDQWGISTGISMRNTGTAPINYHVNVTEPVPWLQFQSPLTGVMDTDYNQSSQGIFFQINFAHFTQPGRYETSINITLSDSTNTQANYQVPVRLFMGEDSTQSSINITAPLNNPLLDPGQTVTIDINQIPPTFGWKRIEYVYEEPPSIDRNNNFLQAFYARTIPPYTAEFTTTQWYNSTTYKLPGTYRVFAKGVLHNGSSVLSNPITIQVKAEPNWQCSQLSGGHCTNINHSAECFTGSNSCSSGSQPYCCPPFSRGSDNDYDADVDFLDLLQLTRVYDTEQPVDRFNVNYSTLFINFLDVNALFSFFGADKN